MKHSLNLMLCLFLSVAAVRAAEPAPPVSWLAKDQQLKVLLSGNSFMQYGGTVLWGPLQMLVAGTGSRLPMDWQAYTMGGSSIATRWKLTGAEREAVLDQHGNRDPRKRQMPGTMAEVIAKGKYHLLVLQQHSNGENILEDARPVVAAAHQAGTAVALFMTWSFKAEMGPAFPEQDRLNADYRKAADALGTGLIPIGPMWRRLKTDLPKINLYADGKHASAAGQQVNALMVYAYLSGSDLSEVSGFAKNLGKDLGEAATVEAQIRTIIAETLAKEARWVGRPGAAAVP